jgi:hypothetical protein
MRYDTLSKTRKSDPKAGEWGYEPELWRDLDLLYRGGYAIQREAERFLPRAINETEERYRARLKLSSYVGYFGKIVNAYVSGLFEKPAVVLPPGDAENAETPGVLPDRAVYDNFAHNADLRGGSFVHVVRELVTKALTRKRALVAIDFPSAPAGVEVMSRAESDRLGLGRPYCYEVPLEEMIDWEYDSVVRRRVEFGAHQEHAVEFEVGRFLWAVLKRRVSRRGGPEDAADTVVEEFTVWRRNVETGRVTWERYRTPRVKVGERIPPNTELELVQTAQETSFKEIPLIELSLPDTLWLGNLLGPLVTEVWQRRSELRNAEQRALMVIPTVYLAPEVGAVGGALPAEAAQDPSRGDDPHAKYEKQGYLVLGNDDRLAFESPPTAVFDTSQRAVDALVDEVHRVAGVMASSISSTSQALARSGVSKAMDRADFVTVLGALGVIVTDVMVRIYDVIASARDEQVMWAVHGFDSFAEGVDRAAELEEALAVDSLNIPSPTWRTEFLVRKALALVQGLSPETQRTVRDEITSNLGHDGGGRESSLPPPPRLPTGA